MANAQRRAWVWTCLPVLTAVAAVGTVLSGLTIGIGPIGGDPDLMYRPIKHALAESYRQGRLPLWSDLFGLGMPLAAESHAAALYPPNRLFYAGWLRVDASYRWSMWLHHLFLAASTYLYARSLRVSPWGSSFAAVAFTLCGFSAAHACHEPFYHILPYLPLILWLTERCSAEPETSRRRGWLAGIALAWGAQLTLGHFQIQFWTAVLAILTAAWRTRSWRPTLFTALALGWGAAIASPQLIATWELLNTSGFQRGFDLLSKFALPPGHWSNPASPWTFAWLPASAEHPYWSALKTTGTETQFYVGTLGLLFGFIGAFGPGWRQDRPLALWRLIAPISLVLASLVLWAPSAYELWTKIPGMGTFRSPGRYVLLACLGWSMLAGRGFDQAFIDPPNAGRRIGWALGLGLGCLAAGIIDAAWRFLEILGTPTVIQAAALAAGTGITSAIAIGFRPERWRRSAPPWLIVASAIELGAIFYAGHVRWGWTVSPAQSAILTQIQGDPDARRIGGPLRNLPTVLGIGVAYPYTGITPPPPTYLLEPAAELGATPNPDSAVWMRRLGVTMTVRKSRDGQGTVDPVLNRLLGEDEQTSWTITRFPDAFPAARAAIRAEVLPSWPRLYSALAADRGPETARFLQPEVPEDYGREGGARARTADVRSWDGRFAVVEHDGTCDLIIQRVHYPGWSARINDGPSRAVVPADGGLQSVRLAGAGVSQVEFLYDPPARRASMALGGVALLAASAIVIQSLRRGRRAWRDLNEENPETP